MDILYKIFNNYNKILINFEKYTYYTIRIFIYQL